MVKRQEQVSIWQIKKDSKTEKLHEGMQLFICAFRAHIFHYWLNPHRDLSIDEDTYTPQKMVEDMSALESEEYAA